jgi:signal transduction histidine kinase
LNSASLGLQLLQKEANKFNTKQHKHQLPLFPSAFYPDLADVESFLELIADTNDACNIAIDILNDLLLYEKIDGGLLTMDATDVSLESFVKDVVKVFIVQVRQKRLFEFG